MPNWVFNELTVTGAPEELATFKEEIAKPYTTNHWDFVRDDEGNVQKVQRESLHESPLSFWNAIAPTDFDAYYGEEKKPNGERTSEQIWQDISEGFRSGMDWYNWNVRNWGTKWDACNVEFSEISNPVDGAQLYYAFDTAWSIPEPAMIAMSEKYPKLYFLLYSKEEQGWGAEIEFKAGEPDVIREWDIPNSHAEHMEEWGECWKCMDYPEDLYDDCPKPNLTEIPESGNVVA